MRELLLPFKRAKIPETPRVAVLLIDMQPFFLQENEQEAALIQAQKNALQYWADRDTPLVVVEYKHYVATIPSLQDEIARFKKKTVLRKSDDDGFRNTGLADMLRAYGANTLLVMGVNASVCVLKTARSGVKHGFHILTAKTLIADASMISYALPRWYRRNSILFENEQKLIHVARMWE